MPQVPAVDEVSLPGRVLFRSGLKAQISASALRLGEGALTTDNWNGWLGDESQNPPHWPTSKTVGDFDWTNLNPFYKNINVETINNKKLGDLFNDYITTGATPVLTIINENLKKTVYSPNADFADLEAAYAWLSQRTISTLGSVTLIFPVQKIVETKTYTINHPNGDRIYWKGADLKTPLPAYTALQVSGYTQAAQANDAAANLALLRNSFSTEIYFTNGGQINFTGNLGSVSNILFSSDGALGGKQYVDGILILSGSTVTFSNCAVTGFDYRGVIVQASANMSVSAGTTFISFGNGGGGISVAINSLMGFTAGIVCTIGNGVKHASDFSCVGLTITDNSLTASYPYYNDLRPSILYSAGNSSTGVYLGSATLSGIYKLVVRLNGQVGITSVNSSTLSAPAGAIVSDNAGQGIQCSNFSLVSIPQATVTNNSGVGIGCYNSSFVVQTGSNVSNNGVNYSPALNTLGNTNSLIS
jgi:hypothetical protein